MNGKRLIIGLWILLVAGVSAADAQLNSLRPGDRVCIVARKYYSKPVFGEFEGIQTDTLYMSLDNEIVALATRDLQRVQQSLGRKDNKVTGVLAGAAIGGIVMGLTASQAVSSCDSFGCVGITNPAGASFLGTAYGATLGFLVGKLIHTEVWRDVRIDRDETMRLSM